MCDCKDSETCPQCKFKVGDNVIYDGMHCTIEKDYGCGVYFVGGEDWFADLVNGQELDFTNP